MNFFSKFHTLLSSAKILKIGEDLTKLQRVQRWELFFETQCISYLLYTGTEHAHGPRYSTQVTNS